MRRITSLFQRVSFAAVLCLYTLSINGQSFQQHIRFLANDSLQGRPPGTVYEKMAADYILKQLQQTNCDEAFLQSFPFYQDSAVNVIGLRSHNSDSTIIICAHFDHLGLGGAKSLEVKKKGIHNGADDNASGVAMMIELAKWSGQIESKYNLLFVAFSAHEVGLFGSSFFAKSDYFKRLKIRAIVNFDMVGRLDKQSQTLRISGADSDTGFGDFFDNHQTTFKFRFDDEVLSNTDLAHFLEMQIPLLNFSTGIHDDYHKTTDDESKINYQGMEQIFEMVKDLLTAL